MWGRSKELAEGRGHLLYFIIFLSHGETPGGARSTLYLGSHLFYINGCLWPLTESHGPIFFVYLNFPLEMTNNCFLSPHSFHQVSYTAFVLSI